MKFSSPAPIPVGSIEPEFFEAIYVPADVAQSGKNDDPNDRFYSLSTKHNIRNFVAALPYLAGIRTGLRQIDPEFLNAYVDCIDVVCSRAEPGQRYSRTAEAADWHYDDVVQVLATNFLPGEALVGNFNDPSAELDMLEMGEALATISDEDLTKKYQMEIKTLPQDQAVYVSEDTWHRAAANTTGTDELRLAAVIMFEVPRLRSLGQLATISQRT